jgi:hypothetical protein
MTVSSAYNALSLCSVLHFIFYFVECRYAQCHYAECGYVECRYAECHYAECCYAECRYVECRSAINNTGACPLSWSIFPPGKMIL